MREQKFRAWDKFNKEMRDILQISWHLRQNYNGTTMKQVLSFVEYFDFEKKKHIRLYPNYIPDYYLPAELPPELTPTFELMQFTGLLDRRGKEIWEGDIVLVLNYLNGKIWEGHTHYDEVIFVRGGFDLKNPWCHESLAYNAVEVVGNKWEGFKFKEV